MKKLRRIKIPTLNELEKLKRKYAREDAEQDREEELARERQEEREEQEREEERIQNELYTPWQRLSTWGRFKYITSGILWMGLQGYLLFLSLSYFYNGNLFYKIISTPFVIFFGYSLFFWIDKMRDFFKYINTLKGKRPQIKFLDFI